MFFNVKVQQSSILNTISEPGMLVFLLVSLTNFSHGLCDTNFIIDCHYGYKRCVRSDGSLQLL